MSRLQVKQYAQEKIMLTNVLDTIRSTFYIKKISSFKNI